MPLVDILNNPGSNFVVSYLAKKGLDWLWDKGKFAFQGKEDPFEKAVQKYEQEGGRAILSNDFRRWFREQYDSGLFERLAIGESVDEPQIIPGFCRAFKIHIKPEEAPDILKRFLDIFAFCLLHSLDGESFHYDRVEHQHQHQDVHLHEFGGKIEQIQSGIAVLAATVQAQHSDLGKDTKNKWRDANRQIRDLIKKNAIETAYTLCELTLQEQDIGQAPVEDIAKIENNMACCLLRLGCLSESIVHFERAMTLAPLEDKYRNNYLTARSNSKPIDPELLPQIEAQLSKDANPQLQAAKGMVLAALKGPKVALQWMRQYAELAKPTSDILYSSAMIAMRIPDYSAAGALADKGIALAPDDPDLIRVKADILMMRNIYEEAGCYFPQIRMTTDQASEIRESVTWYTRALDKLSIPRDQRKFQMSEVLTQRGIARMMLGELDSAFNDFQKAIEYNPKETTAHYNRLTINIRFEGGETIEEDVRFLLENEQCRLDVLRKYAAYLAEKGRIEDIEAIARRYPEDMKSHIELGFVLALARDANHRPYKHARYILREWRKSHPHESHHWLRAWAHVLINMGHERWAEKVLLHTIALARTNEQVQGANAAQALAGIYTKQKLWKKACDTYRSYIAFTSYSPDLPEYLFAQMNAEGISSTLKTIRDVLCPSIRKHPNIMFLWAQMEEAAGNLHVASRLFFRLWRDKDSEESAARCAHCLYRRPQTRQRTRIVLLHIKHFDKMRPEIAMIAAAMLADFGYYEKALNVAYKVTIRNQANRHIEERYAGLIFMQCHEKLNLQPIKCEKGGIVDVNINGEKKCWHLDPSSTEPLLPNCEPLRDEKVITALIDRRVGETFTYAGRNDEVIKGSVNQIRRKELKLLHEILDHVRIRPENNSMFHAVRADVDVLLKELNRYARDRVNITQIYRDNKWPIAWLAAGHNRSLVEIYWALLNGEESPLDAFPGDPQFFEQHNVIAASTSPFILDLQALQLLVRFDILYLLETYRHRCLISQTAVDALTGAIQTAKLSEHSEMTLIPDGIGGATIQKVSPLVRKIYQDHLTKCEAFIRSLHYDQILPKPKTHELPEKAESVLSQPIAEMIELSRERNLPVLLGDIRLSGLIRPGLYFTVRTLIDIAQRDNRMPIEKVAKVLGEMKLAGLQYISVSDDILIAASDLLIMQENSTTYAALFSQLSPAQSNWPTVLPILTRCLTRFAVMRWINDNQRQNLIAATLSAVFGKSYKRRYLQELALAVRANLELAPIQLRSTMQTIRVWESIQAFQNKI